MPDPVNLRLANLLASLTVGLHDDTTTALQEASGLTGSGPAALLALAEFLDGTHVGRLAEVLGLTHSGAVRLVALLEQDGLAERRPGLTDRRQVEVVLTDRGRRVARRSRAARGAVLAQALGDLDDAGATRLEALLDGVVRTRVRARVGRRTETGAGAAWWCRTCDFAACGRSEGRCPAQVTAAALLSP